jgi:hypothetical protein
MAELLRGKKDLPPQVKATVDATPDAAEKPPAQFPRGKVKQQPVAAAESAAAAQAHGPPRVAPGQDEALRRAGLTGEEPSAQRAPSQPKFNRALNNAKRAAKDASERDYRAETEEHPENEGKFHAPGQGHDHNSVQDQLDKVRALPTKPQR